MPEAKDYILYLMVIMAFHTVHLDPIRNNCVIFKGGVTMKVLTGTQVLQPSVKIKNSKAIKNISKTVAG